MAKNFYEFSIMSTSRQHLLDFKQPNVRLLHSNEFAFFLSFVVWFYYAPLLALAHI